jgi:hypothetical protein
MSDEERETEPWLGGEPEPDEVEKPEREEESDEPERETEPWLGGEPEPDEPEPA